MSGRHEYDYKWRDPEDGSKCNSTIYAESTADARKKLKEANIPFESLSHNRDCICRYGDGPGEK